jgi:hypothetical protein
MNWFQWKGAYIPDLSDMESFAKRGIISCYFIYSSVHVTFSIPLLTTKLCKVKGKDTFGI